MPDKGMTSSKPYLLRALYEWIIDNDLTPHIIVDTQVAGTDLPEHDVQDGRLVLNVSPMATRGLELGNEAVSFQARFAGVSRDIFLPIHAVLAIYARENGQGMMFSGGEPGPPEDDGRDKSSGPKLRVIK
jgi:stringent starvation protein B